MRRPPADRAAQEDAEPGASTPDGTPRPNQEDPRCCHGPAGWPLAFAGTAYARRPALVLLNGLAEQAESWFRNQTFWRRHFEVYLPNMLVYDGPGLHARIEAGLPITVEYLVDQLHQYLKNYVQTPYHLVAAEPGR